MRRVKLDRIDIQILSDLQADGRMTNVELARRVCRFALQETGAFPTTREDAFAEQLANGTYGDARRLL